MNKKAKIYFAIIIWAALFAQIIVNNGMNKKDTIIEAFNVSESVPLESSLTAFGYYGDMELSDDVKKNMVKNLAANIGIYDEYNVTFEQQQTYNKCVLNKKGKNADTRIQIVSITGLNENGERTVKQYIGFDIYIYGDTAQIIQFRDEINGIYDDLDVDKSINLCLKGIIEGKINEEKQEELAIKLLKEMNAEYVDSSLIDKMYTVYGYNDSEKAVLLNGNKINANITFVYDEENNDTIIQIAQPFVNGLY